MARNNSPYEGEEQKLVVEYCRLLRIPLFAIPNGGSRRISEAVRLKSQGVSPGVPDLMIPVARGVYHGLFIEMKRRKGSKVEPEQIAWLERLNAEGYCARICHGFDEAKRTIDRYMRLKKIEKEV